ncbi:MAG: hypothetical protein KatS3mg108_2174 [Isosphaeraceae bacterium]|jgi:hypothetical protein|nr:MAG: hypothetical protein KatS3mg108_2174 [Isosphaeraceae bacterium]
MTQTPLTSPQVRSSRLTSPSGQPLTTTLLLILIAALIWNLAQAQSREADLNKRLQNLAAGYQRQRELRRELYIARQTIARLRVGLETEVTPLETADVSR